MPPALRVAVLLCLACTPAAPSTTPATGPAPAAITTTTPPGTCLLGSYSVAVQQRMIQDSGETALLEDQRIGAVPVLFAAQREALRDAPAQTPGQSPPPVPNAPQALLLLTGARVTEQLDDLEYIDNNGAKPTDTRTVTRPYTFFLADTAANCDAVAADLAGVPQGEVGPAACPPPDLRARCTPLDLGGKIN